MKRFTVGSIVKLWLLYQENGTPVSGKTNLLVDVQYNGTTIYTSPLTEEGTTGVYSVQWDSSLSSIIEGDVYETRYLEDTSILSMEEVLFDNSILEIKENVELIKGIETGRWRIVNNQMIFYADDNTTVLAQFNLYDKTGSPASEDVYERRKV